MVYLRAAVTSVFEAFPAYCLSMFEVAIQSGIMGYSECYLGSWVSRLSTVVVVVKLISLQFVFNIHKFISNLKI